MAQPLKSILLFIVFLLCSVHFAFSSTEDYLTAEELKEWLIKAEQGDAEHQFRVGFAIALMTSDNSQLNNKAFRWLTLAAEQGHVLGQSQLGEMYY